MNRGLIYNFICLAVRLFVKRPTVAGAGRFQSGRDAMIVSNHEGAWGPVVTRAWFPLPTAPWVNGAITVRGECRKFLSGFFFQEQAHMSAWIARPLAVIIEPLLLHILRAGDAVPVYFEGAKATITYKKSIEKLKQGKTLMVFPDNESTLQTLHIPDFHDGYLATARIYYKQTGKKLLFYPLCASSRGNSLELGDPVEFDPESPFKDECRRINGALLDFIRQRYGSEEDRPAQSSAGLPIA